MPQSTELCNPDVHSIYRRQFLGTLGWGLSAAVANLNPLTGLCSESRAAAVRQQDRRVIILYLGGGASQLETFICGISRLDVVRALGDAGPIVEVRVSPSTEHKHRRR